MREMIDYAFLCQAIDDWRAGRRPQIPQSATPTMPGSGVTSTAPLELYPDAPAEVEMAADEAESDLIDVEEPIDADVSEAIDAEAEAEADASEAIEGEAAGLEGEPEGEYVESDVAVAPPDFDSTRVYGSNGDPVWQPTDGEPTER